MFIDRVRKIVLALRQEGHVYRRRRKTDSPSVRRDMSIIII